MDLVLIGSAIAGFAIFFMLAGVVVLTRARPSEIAERFDKLPVSSVAIGVGATVTPMRAKPGPIMRLLGAGSAPDLATDLARADLRMAPAEFRTINFGTMMLGFILGFVIFHQNWIVTLLGGFVGLMAPRWYLRYLQNKRLTAFNKQLPDTMTLLANSLRSGFSLLQSMATVSQELPPPISAEFGRVVREVGLGLTLPEAMLKMLRRVPSDDLDFLITAINIQYEVGGNLAQVLDTIAYTIRARVRVLREVHVLTTQQRISAIILTLLPVVAALGLYLMNPKYMTPLFTTTCGMQMLGAGAIMIFIGYILVQKVAKIEV